MRIFLRSKISGLKVTDTSKGCGSIALDPAYINRVLLVPYEQVHVLNNTTGARIITYVIPGEKDEVKLMGPARFKFSVGDEIVILAYEMIDDAVNQKHWEVDYSKL